MNIGEACDVNEDPLVHIEVQNDKNEDVNEQRQVEDNVLANEPVVVEETPTDGNEQKQAADMNNCPYPVGEENEQRQATDLPNDDQTRVEEIEKRRKLDNVDAFDPFRELDSAKADDLENWLVNAPDM
ncbi:Hypothetical predicted protein [Olea europaea subsp. europaea]|uniref:Uncharacterized protein n=1 Tax=Olea europaea subsp. europaea TaxID=158383 RepID=A0A8S0RF81_OLEEU|nr:Hypothetical predicted protein [Olea europaea subsp. europaea]